MTSIDPRVTEKLKEAGDHRVPVLIICGNACESVREALDKAGIKISGTESMVLGIISAELTADEVTTANSVAGVTYVEFDEEAKTLRNR